MDIIWGSRAESSYRIIRSNIRERFTEKEEAVFVEQVFETIASIGLFPKAYPETKRVKAARKAVIHPHTTLFYRIESEKQIRLLLFWDNRKDMMTSK